MSQDKVVLKIKDVCGPHCVGIEDGTGLFTRILPILKTGSEICLDFEDVLTITSSFLNVSVGKLFGHFKESDLEKRLTWKCSDESDNQLIKLVVRNAKEHFAKPETTRKMENDIVKRNIIEEE